MDGTEIYDRNDYYREAYGDRCPRHPEVMRGGADCWKCEEANEIAEAEELAAERAQERHEEMRSYMSDIGDLME